MSKKDFYFKFSIMLFHVAILVLLFFVFTARASDVTKYNPLGNNEVRETVVHTDSERLILLKGPIRDSSEVVDKMKYFFRTLRRGESIFLVLNTPGGSVSEGYNIINMMKVLKNERGIKTICLIEDMAMSMGAMIQSFCYRSYMLTGSSLMYHGMAYGVRGSHETIKRYVGHLDDLNEEMEEELAIQIGLPLEEYQRLRTPEVWYNSKKAARYGLIDGTLKYLYYEVEEQETGNLFQELLKVFK